MSRRRLLILCHPGHRDLPGLAEGIGGWVFDGAVVSALGTCEDVVAELAARLSSVEIDLLVAVGGDGTVGAAVGAMDRAGVLGNTGLAVVPAGTGNDLAAQIDPARPRRDRALGRVSAWISDLTGAARLSPVDLVRWEDGDRSGVFANVISVGPAARMTATTPDSLKDGLGSLAYLLHGLTRLDEVQPFPVQVEAEGFAWEGEALGVFVANGRRAGGGMTIAEEASLDSGEVRVVVVPDMPTGALARVMSSGLAGRPEDQEELVVADLSTLRLVLPDGTDASVDGEPHTLRDVSLTVQPGALSLLQPPG